MILPRLLACLTGLVALILSFYVYREYVFFLGFPDGHVTDLGATERKLAVVFIDLSVPLGLCLIGLSSVPGGRKVRWSLLIAVVLYLLVLAGTIALDRHYQSSLDNGIGG